MNKKIEDEVEKDSSVFTKEQILKADRYQNYRDILLILLNERTYTIEEVEKEIEKFMRIKVIS